MYMKLKDGKSKVLTLSYDDGVVQDIRLMEILNKHGLKCTFNIDSGMYLPEEVQRQQYRGRLKLSEAVALYKDSGHEVAAHTLNHRYLNLIPMDEVLTEVLDDRRNLEVQYGTMVRGMAYPYGRYNEEVVDALKKCGICYSRTTRATHGFDLPERWLTLHPTCHHNDPELMELAKEFAEGQPRRPEPNWLFYLWGHSYEFDDRENWNVIEEFAAYMGGREDIWYATNIELYDYVQAYNSLQTNVDKTRIYNPTATCVWVMQAGKTYCIEGGQTLCL